MRGEGVRRRGVRSEGEAYQDYRRGCGQNYSQQRTKDVTHTSGGETHMRKSVNNKWDSLKMRAGYLGCPPPPPLWPPLPPRPPPRWEDH